MPHALQRLCLIFFCCALYACSNGRGSVGEGAPAGESPPPTAPTPPPSEPTPPPSEPAPPPSEPTPPAPTPEPPARPPPAPNPDPEPTPVRTGFAGYWSGSVREQGGARSRTGIAFVDASGDMHLMVLREGDDPEFVLHGNICCAPRAEQKLGGHRYLDTREHDADIDAERADESLRGEFEFRGRDYGFTLRPLAAYDQALTLPALAGVYTRSVDRGPGSPWSMSLSIAADGAVTGSHSNGCVFNGSASLPDARNLVRLNLALSGCGGRDSSRHWNGSYRGFGVLLRNATSPSDGVTREDTFYFSLVGPTWLGALSVGR